MSAHYETKFVVEFETKKQAAAFLEKCLKKHKIQDEYDSDYECLKFEKEDFYVWNYDDEETEYNCYSVEKNTASFYGVSSGVEIKEIDSLIKEFKVYEGFKRIKVYQYHMDNSDSWLHVYPISKEKFSKYLNISEEEFDKQAALDPAKETEKDNEIPWLIQNCSDAVWQFCYEGSEEEDFLESDECWDILDNAYNKSEEPPFCCIYVFKDGKEIYDFD